MSERRLRHDHEPIYRVVRASWNDPLDASFSRTAKDRRWNPPEFAALYCCCSEAVARGIAWDVFGFASVDPEDLQPGLRPQLAEIDWSGELVDMVSEEGVQAAGFAADYPVGVDKKQTRQQAETWHGEEAEGVCCRSASLQRQGRSTWQGDHRAFGELALFVDHLRRQPQLRQRRTDLGWLRAKPAP